MKCQYEQCENNALIGVINKLYCAEHAKKITDHLNNKMLADAEKTI